MALRRYYMRLETDEAVQLIFFVLNVSWVDDDCPVCFDKINDSDSVVCHQCNKPLHLTCVELWFNTNVLRICPHCRSSWKFEIEIEEKVADPYTVELDEHTPMPIFNTYRNRYIVRGSISGHIGQSR